MYRWYKIAIPGLSTCTLKLVDYLQVQADKQWYNYYVDTANVLKSRTVSSFCSEIKCWLSVIHSQFWTSGHWDLLFRISMSPTANL